MAGKKVETPRVLVTRAEAKAAGLKRYFTGKPCKHGHIDHRSTVNGMCIECQREKDRRGYVPRERQSRERPPVVVPEHKVCPWCEQEKAAAEYSAAPSRRDGLAWCCKACAVVRTKAWVAANPERARLRSQAYFQAHKTALMQKHKVWLANNPDKAREAPEIRAARHRAWRQANPARWKMHRAASAAKRRDAEGDGYTASDVAEILKAQRNKCAICRVSFRRVPWEVDHIKPLGRKGRNERRNIQLLCTPCNRAKRAQDPIEYMQSLGRLL